MENYSFNNEGFSPKELLDRSELDFIEKNSSSLHKYHVTEYYASLAGSEKNDPVRMQFVPDKRELVTLPYEKSDPLCEVDNKAGRRIIKRYHDRVLFLVTARCAMYCRHCFRRYYAGSAAEDVTDRDINELVRVISENENIKEVLLTGGDPLILSNSRLSFILESIRGARKDIVIRIGTRIPVALPSRIDDGLLSVLSLNRPVYVFTQFNHFRELTSKSRCAAEKIINKGIPLFNQTVLLKGINDDEAVLEKLFHDLVYAGIKPYYLFQGDLAAGTSHFRVPLARGLEIMENLSRRMSGLSLPVYAVDLPGGGGKVRLFSGSAVPEGGGANGDGEAGFFRIKNYEGEEYLYPDES